MNINVSRAHLLSVLFIYVFLLVVGMTYIYICMNVYIWSLYMFSCYIKSLEKIYIVFVFPYIGDGIYSCLFFA